MYRIFINISSYKHKQIRILDCQQKKNFLSTIGHEHCEDFIVTVFFQQSTFVLQYNTMRCQHEGTFFIFTITLSWIIDFYLWFSIFLIYQKELPSDTLNDVVKKKRKISKNM